MAFLWTLCCLALTAATANGCGKPAIPPVINGYSTIVNGEEAVPHSWPWQVSLQTFRGFHFCGGSLINENWVVTAAHCGVSARHQIVLGEHDRSSNAERIQVMRVAKAITHPGYSRQTLDNDIMLVKLDGRVRLNAQVSPVCLASARDNFPRGMTCVTTGWGRARFNSPARLQQASVPLWTNRDCRRRVGSILTNQMICAGGNGVSTCFGDSGGPLVCRRRGSWTLVGVTSWVVNNCGIESPAGFARVQALRSWIDQTLAAN